MKTVILAGGLGTRLSEYTQVIPKPMVEVGGKPLLWHIMNRYSKYGFTDFIIALGYKGDYIKDYFINYYALNNDFEVYLSSGEIKKINEFKQNWKITLVDTGNNTLTGGRVKRIQGYIGNETFMLTYGDAVADIDINKLVQFHKQHGKIATVTAVHPPARFGELEINDQNNVISFKEKPQIKQGWINGGFFVFEADFFNYLNGDSSVLEGEPLEKVSEIGQLNAYLHNDFWHCVDTVRDLKVLQEIWDSGKVPW